MRGSGVEAPNRANGSRLTADRPLIPGYEREERQTAAKGQAPQGGGVIQQLSYDAASIRIPLLLHLHDADPPLLVKQDEIGASRGLLAPWAAFNAADIGEGYRGSVSRYLGLLATTTKCWEEAEHHFEDALAMNANMGARPWLAHTKDEYARLLLARARSRRRWSYDEASDRDRAAELFGEAHATYRELGMESWAARTSALKREVGTVG